MSGPLVLTYNIWYTLHSFLGIFWISFYHRTVKYLIRRHDEKSCHVRHVEPVLCVYVCNVFLLFFTFCPGCFGQSPPYTQIHKAIVSCDWLVSITWRHQLVLPNVLMLHNLSLSDWIYKVKYFKLVIIWIVIKESFDLILNLITVSDLTILQYSIRRGGRRIACFYFLDFHWISLFFICPAQFLLWILLFFTVIFTAAKRTTKSYRAQCFNWVCWRAHDVIILIFVITFSVVPF